MSCELSTQLSWRRHIAEVLNVRFFKATRALAQRGASRVAAMVANANTRIILVVSLDDEDGQLWTGKSASKVESQNGWIKGEYINKVLLHKYRIDRFKLGSGVMGGPRVAHNT